MCIQGLGGPESCTYRANPSAATGHRLFLPGGPSASPGGPGDPTREWVAAKEPQEPGGKDGCWQDRVASGSAVSRG